MPFNRVNNIKATSFWLALLQSEAKKEADRQSSIALGHPPEQHEEKKMNRYIKALIDPQQPYCWVPGILVVPIPEAGFFLGYVDVAFWATFLYVVGSIIYVADCFYLWVRFNPDYTDDANNPAIYLNTFAAAMFVFNALVCFLDWYLQVQQLSAMNMFIDEELTGGLHVSDIPMTITWYYFFNNLFFLGAAVIFLIQGIWAEDISTDLEDCVGHFCNDFWINFWGNFLYLVSSLFSCAESFADRALRKRDGLPMVYLFSMNFNDFDWFGWGDIIYVFVSISALAQTFFMFNENITDDDSSVYYLYVNLFFLVDSIVYFIGYMQFIYELKRGIVTGKVPVSQTVAISNLIGDNFEESEDDTYRNLKSFVMPANAEGFVDLKAIQESLRTARTIRIRRTAALFRASDASSVTGKEKKENEVINPIRNTIATSTDISNKEKNALKSTFSIARRSQDYL